jgi:lipoprotein NlpD
MNVKRRVAGFVLLAGVLLAGCGAHVNHVVKPNETLYSISFRYGQDFRDVARWNGIEPPYEIRPGQQIRIIPPAREPARVATRSAPATPATVTRPAADAREPLTSSSPSVPPAPRTAPAAVGAGPLDWQWPVTGVYTRSDMAVKAARRGLEISAARGEPVRAAASGRVVYGGSGIPHYGNLLIIKHNEKFLSAYAHNERLLVSEGQEVAAGQQIAEMGDSGTGTSVVKLHFEIRQDGEPVDPLRYLPRR